MSFINFLSAHWTSIIAVVVFVAICAILIKKGYSKYVKQILFYLVCEAEQQFGSGTGTLKYAAVTAWVHERLPAIVKIFLTEKEIDKLIEAAVAEMKQWLEVNEKAKLLINENIIK